MARRKQSRGKCAFCGRERTRGGLARHLSACPQRQEAISTADPKLGKDAVLYHLQVQDAWQGDFWLHLEMEGLATLEDLAILALLLAPLGVHPGRGTHNLLVALAAA